LDWAIKYGRPEQAKAQACALKAEEEEVQKLVLGLYKDVIDCLFVDSVRSVLVRWEWRHGALNSIGR
jgi:hypothetical protein